jgi:5'-nucleotidase
MNERVGRRLVVQAGRYGTAFDDVRLTVNARTGQVVASEAEIVAVDHSLAPVPALTELVAGYRALVAPIAGQVVAMAGAPAGRTRTPTGESAIGDLVADAQRRAAGAEVALVAPGALRADLPAGPVTLGDAFAVQPWDDGVVATTLSGSQLRDALGQQFGALGTRILQVSGLGWRRSGRTVADVTVGGAPLDDDRAYRVAVSASLAAGADGFPTLAAGRDVERVTGDLEALVDLLRSLPEGYAPPDPAAEPRISSGA